MMGAQNTKEAAVTTLIRGWLALLALVFAGQALAQTYPSRPVRSMVWIGLVRPMAG